MDAAVRRLLYWRKLDRSLPGWNARQSAIDAVCSLPRMPQWPRVLRRTLLTPARLRSLERLVSRCDGLPGIVMECGTARGGSALLLALSIARRDRPRELWLCDTFEERVVQPSENDPDADEKRYLVGQNRGAEDEIRRLLSPTGVKVHTVKGLYQATLPALDVPPIALLHLDANWYDSTMTCLTHLWPRVVEGGFVQLDDYGSFKGCKKAVHDYFGPTIPEVHVVDHDGVWVRKG